MEMMKHIYRFTANNPGAMTYNGTNQYLLGKDDITVIDVALSADENVDGILGQVEAMGGKRICQIILTHIHKDHCGGALALKKRSGAKLGISKVREGFLGGEDYAYRDGEKIPYDGGELVVIHTPGHESGHCCFYDSEQQVLFTGDHILGKGTTVVPFPDGDMAAYIKSLEKLLPYKLRKLLPGHGPLIDDPYRKIREYIEHRLMREMQVLGCLREGIQIVESMVQTIYKEYPPSLLPMACLSVNAHLLKLIQEDKVIQKENEYCLTDRV